MWQVVTNEDRMDTMSDVVECMLSCPYGVEESHAFFHIFLFFPVIDVHGDLWFVARKYGVHNGHNIVSFVLLSNLM